jgi:hypothetical protein
MQVTLELPDQLVSRIESEDSLAELIEAGLRTREWTGASGLAAEVIRFLGSGPRLDQIIAFHPSEAAAARARELLDRNREGALSASETAELDEMALLDHLMTLVKARAFEQTKSK